MADPFEFNATALDSPARRTFDQRQVIALVLQHHAARFTVGGDEVTFVGLAAGSILPVATSRVDATDTTATNIVALW